MAMHPVRRRTADLQQADSDPSRHLNRGATPDDLPQNQPWCAQSVRKPPPSTTPLSAGAGRRYRARSTSAAHSEAPSANSSGLPQPSGGRHRAATTLPAGSIDRTSWVTEVLTDPDTCSPVRYAVPAHRLDHRRWPGYRAGRGWDPISDLSRHLPRCRLGTFRMGFLCAFGSLRQQLGGWKARSAPATRKPIRACDPFS